LASYGKRATTDYIYIRTIRGIEAHYGIRNLYILFIGRWALWTFTKQIIDFMNRSLGMGEEDEVSVHGLLGCDAT
jgi:hypothetical protein